MNRQSIFAFFYSCDVRLIHCVILVLQFLRILKKVIAPYHWIYWHRITRRVHTIKRHITRDFIFSNCDFSLFVVCKWFDAEEKKKMSSDGGDGDDIVHGYLPGSIEPYVSSRNVQSIYRKYFSQKLTWMFSIVSNTRDFIRSCHFHAEQIIQSSPKYTSNQSVRTEKCRTRLKNNVLANTVAYGIRE